MADQGTEPPVLDEYPEWTAKAEWKLPNWGEAVMIVGLLSLFMYITRRRNYRIFGSTKGRYRSILDADNHAYQNTDNLLYHESDDDDQRPPYTSDNNLPKSRSCCGLCTIHTPNSSRFKNHIHSRLLQKLPFLVEMLYWVLNYLFYRMTTVASNELFKGTGIWEAAKGHALAILSFEQESWLSFLFPVHEITVQSFFMHGHQDFITFMDRAYSIVHIPGTIAFIGWYYYVAPSHATFATVRRTMTLTNFMAFVTFIFYPVMPPRLLPKEYGFLDTVRMEDAQSLWMSGKFVNSLAAMPSMHFGYAFIIGCTFIYHSGVFRSRMEKYETRKNIFWKAVYITLGILYPTGIFITIIATANHYYLDVCVAFLYVWLAFLANKVFCVFLPLEDLLLFVIRAEKPIPSTGERFHARGGKI